MPWIRQASLDDMDSLDDLLFLRDKTLRTGGVVVAYLLLKDFLQM